MLKHFIVTPEGSLPIEIDNCIGFIMLIDRQAVNKRVGSKLNSTTVVDCEPLPVIQLHCERAFRENDKNNEEIHILIDPRCFDA